MEPSGCSRSGPLDNAAIRTELGALARLLPEQYVVAEGVCMKTAPNTLVVLDSIMYLVLTRRS